MLLCLTLLFLFKHIIIEAKVITMKNLDFLSNGNPTSLDLSKQNEKVGNHFIPEDNIPGKDDTNKVRKVNVNTLESNTAYSTQNVKQVNGTNNSDMNKDNISSYEVGKIYSLKNENKKENKTKKENKKTIEHLKKYVPISEEIEVPGFLQQRSNQKMDKDGLRLLPYF